MPRLGLINEAPLTQEFTQPSLPPVPELPPVNSPVDSTPVPAITTGDTAEDPSSTGLSAFIQDQIEPPTLRELAAQSMDLAKASYLQNRISMKDRGIRATKDFFLASSSASDCANIPSDMWINGIILSIPFSGSEEYKINWVTDSLPTQMNKSNLRVKVSKRDASRMAQLRMARFYFDLEYPQGEKGVLHVGSKKAPRKRRTISSSARRTKSKKMSVAATNQRNDDIDVVAERSRLRDHDRNQKLANMRMSPVDTDLIQGRATANTLPDADVDPSSFIQDDSDDSGVEEDGRNGASEDVAAEEVHSPSLTQDDVLHG
jgi:hypothetical protein